MSTEAMVSPPPERMLLRRWPQLYLYGWYAALLVSLVLGFYGRPLVAAAVLGLATVFSFTRWLVRWPTILTTLILCVLLIPASIYKLPASLPIDVELYRLVVFVLFGMWAVALLTDPAVRLRRTFLDRLFLLAAIAFVVSFVANLADFEPTLEYSQSAKGLFYVLTFIILYYCLVSIVRDNALATRLVHTIVYVTAVLAVLAMFERITGYNPFRHLNEFIPVLEPSALEVAATELRGGLRVAGSAAHPIAFGTMLGLVLPLPIEFLLESKRMVERVKWGTISVVVMVAMLLTVSRTAFLAIVATLVALAFTRPKQRWVLVLSAIVAAVAIHMFFPGVVGRFIDNLTPSNVVSRELSTRAGRLADYPFIIAEWSRKPLLGRGVGTFTHQRFFYVDNQYLKYLVEGGLFGLVSMVLLFFGSAAALMRRGGRIGGHAGAIVAATGIGALVFGLANLTFDAQGFPQVPYLFYILTALGVAVALNCADDARAASVAQGTTAPTAATEPVMTP